MNTFTMMTDICRRLTDISRDRLNISSTAKTNIYIMLAACYLDALIKKKLSHFQAFILYVGQL